MSIKKIANECGLSVTAVSLVLNNKPNRISEANRKKILAKAKELNYRPNRLAVGLVTGKTNLIGLIVPDIRNAFFAEIARQVAIQAEQLNYSVIIGNTNDTIRNDLAYIQTFTDRKLDGLILIRSTEGTSQQQIDSLSRALYAFPGKTVLIDRDIPNYNGHVYFSNNYAGAYQAVSLLINYGHERIGFISGPRTSRTVMDRLEGYRRALSDAGIPYQDELTFTGDFTTDCGFIAFQALSSQELPSAVFACNDLIAFGFMKAARKAKIRIPQDISIIGFDDIDFADFLEVPLTTVRQPYTLIAKEATVQLIRAIRDDEPARRFEHLYDTALILRDSVRKIR